MEVGCGDIGNEDGRGILLVGNPGGMALDCLSIGLRQAAPGFEAHHALVVEQKNRGAVRMQGLDDRVDGFLVEAGQGLRPVHDIGQVVQEGLSVGEGQEFRFLTFAVGDVEPHGQDMAQFAVFPNPAHTDSGPDRGAVLSPVSLLNHEVRTAGGQPMKEHEVGRQVIRIGDLLHIHPEQFGCTVSEQLAEALIHEQESPGEIGLRDGGRRLADDGLKPCLAVCNLPLRLTSDARHVEMGGDSRE